MMLIAGDQDAGHRVALREARRAVHGAVELRLGGELPCGGAWPRPRRSVRRSGRESIDICLPGRASRVKRAVTSEMRTAPWLMTTYWMAISTRKITAPMM